LPKLSTVGLWFAALLSAPGALLALLVVPSQAIAFSFDVAIFMASSTTTSGGARAFLQPLWLAGLYVAYLAGLACGFLCFYRHVRGATSARQVSLYSAGAIVGFLASFELELTFWRETKRAVPHGYLAATSLLWVCICLVMRGKSRKGSSKSSLPVTGQT
jgi:hypothetical protein